MTFSPHMAVALAAKSNLEAYKWSLRWPIPTRTKRKPYQCTHQCALGTIKCPMLRTYPNFAYTILAFDCHTTNACTKHARHLTVHLVLTGHKQLATCLQIRCYWQPNLWAKQILATLAVPGHAFTPRCTLPRLREHVGVSAAGDI